jgi:hypothetical protein
MVYGYGNFDNNIADEFHHHYTRLEGFSKVAFIFEILNVGLADVGRIVEINDIELLENILYPDLVDTTHQPEESLIHEKLYLVLILFNYLLKMSNYDPEKLRELWKMENCNFYEETIKKPPWYSMGLNNYLIVHKSMGLNRCIEWIKDY